MVGCFEVVVVFESMMFVSALPRDTRLAVAYLDAVASVCLSVSRADPEFQFQGLHC